MTQQLSKPQSTKQIANRLVNECLQVQPNEQVIIASWDHTLEYATALALEVEHAGGISTSTLMGNDFYWAYLKEVPEEQFTRRQKGFLSLLDQPDRRNDPARRTQRSIKLPDSARRKNRQDVRRTKSHRRQVPRTKNPRPQPTSRTSNARTSKDIRIRL